MRAIWSCKFGPSLLPPAYGGASCHTCPLVSVLRGLLQWAPSKPAELPCWGLGS
ncbi:rCG31204, partial [Rattus norvegicus]